MQAIDHSEAPATDAEPPDAVDGVLQAEGADGGEGQPAVHDDGAESADEPSPEVQAAPQEASRAGSREASATLDAQPVAAEGSLGGSEPGRGGGQQGVHYTAAEPSEAIFGKDGGAAPVDMKMDPVQDADSARLSEPRDEDRAAAWGNEASEKELLDAIEDAHAIQADPAINSHEQGIKSSVPAEPEAVMAPTKSEDGWEDDRPSNGAISAQLQLNGQQTSGMGSLSNSATPGRSREGTPAAHKPIRLKLKIGGKPL